MLCPYCKLDDDRVIDSRSAAGGAVIRRRRVCNKCDGRYTTYERREEEPLKVVKRDDSREPFSREKLEGKIRLALTKQRGIPDEKVTEAVDQIEERIHKDYPREVPSSAIAELVMEKLKGLDPVAYVRYASEYRDLRELMDILGDLRPLLGD